MRDERNGEFRTIRTFVACGGRQFRAIVPVPERVHEARRIGATVGAMYDADLDSVQSAIHRTVDGCAASIERNGPGNSVATVSFREFGKSTRVVVLPRVRPWWSRLAHLIRSGWLPSRTYVELAYVDAFDLGYVNPWREIANEWEGA